MDMKTVTVQIGNTDDVLSQSDWSRFFKQAHEVIFNIAARVHFLGTSDGDAPWQNACWVVEVHPDNLAILFRDVARVGRSFQQESVAVTVGETKFI